MSLTRGHILGETPPSSGHQPRLSYVSSLEDAQELYLADFAKIATGLEGYIFPHTLNRSAISTLLVDSTPGGMAPTGDMPPPPRVAPPPRTRTRKQKDQDTPDPMFPTQATATSAGKAFSQGEHRGPYPTMVQRIVGVLRKPQELMNWQREDSHLLGKIQDLDNGRTGGEYLTDDDRLLWYAPPGSILRLAIPCSLVSGILALVHTTFGHRGVARTTDLMQRKYHWTSLKSDFRDYVLSWGCRGLKRSTSQRVAMLPARFLKPWEVLEMDIHDMAARSETGNRHLLVIVDRTSKFLFAYPLPNKTAENVAKKLLELLLTFGIPLSLRSDPRTEFTAEVAL